MGLKSLNSLFSQIKKVLNQSSLKSKKSIKKIIKLTAFIVACTAENKHFLEYFCLASRTNI